MIETVTWPQVLAWRLRRHLLDPVGTESVEDVVRRLGAVQAQVPASAELAVRLRRRQSKLGEVDRALAEGRIIKAWVMRGAVHLLTPEDGGAYLAVKAAGRQWELPSWQSFYRLTPADWKPFRVAVREALADGPLTTHELGDAVTALPKFRHLAFAFAEHASTILKPLFWQGVMSFGPARDGQATFQRLDLNPRWAGLPEPDEAGTRVVESYLRAYGPASVEHVRYWQNAGLKSARTWLAGLGDRLAEVDVDGERAFVLREDLQELAATQPTRAVRLLPGYDQWVLGPGTADPHVVSPGRRQLISRQAAFVISGGVVSGTWAIADDQIIVDWFTEAGPAPQGPLADEVERLSAILDRSLRLRT
ncbi:MAG: winged helix DNA-binding domain-containing protein [Chloroflexi bacterium]|nr:MAG: winged helix DNA-binding domain-containing protein [Chloroflexota bacterium]